MIMMYSISVNAQVYGKLLKLLMERYSMIKTLSMLEWDSLKLVNLKLSSSSMKSEKRYLVNSLKDSSVSKLLYLLEDNSLRLLRFKQLSLMVEQLSLVIIPSNELRLLQMISILVQSLLLFTLRVSVPLMQKSDPHHFVRYLLQELSDFLQLSYFSRYFIE